MDCLESPEVQRLIGCQVIHLKLSDISPWAASTTIGMCDVEQQSLQSHNSIRFCERNIFCFFIFFLISFNHDDSFLSHFRY